MDFGVPTQSGSVSSQAVCLKRCIVTENGEKGMQEKEQMKKELASFLGRKYTCHD